MTKTASTGVYFREDKNNNKTYYIKYLDEEKKQKLTKVGTHTSGIRIPYCTNLRNDILSKIRLGEDLPFLAKNKTLKFDDLADTYFESIKRKEDYKALLGKYNKIIQPYFGQKAVSLITSNELKKFVDYLYECNYANKTILLYFSQIKTIFNHNKRIGTFKGDIPYFKLDISIDNTRERYLDMNEIKELLSILSEKDEITYNFTILALNLGARAESINNLKVGDINFSNNTIQIYDFKRKMTYTSYLNKFLLDFLTQYIKDNQLTKAIYIVSKSATMITYDSIRHKVVPVLNKLFNEELDNDDRKNRVVVHTLRHTFASHLAISGVPIFTIQRLLNHSKIDMTLRYAKLAPSNFFDSVDRLYLG
ncbi:MAG: site-specific integrase [Campylobacterales bacterium]|nr:site-specific integrase [Campylobacterales bacterium]